MDRSQRRAWEDNFLCHICYDPFDVTDLLKAERAPITAPCCGQTACRKCINSFHAAKQEAIANRIKFFPCLLCNSEKSLHKDKLPAPHLGFVALITAYQNFQSEIERLSHEASTSSKAALDAEDSLKTLTGNLQDEKARLENELSLTILKFSAEARIIALERDEALEVKRRLEEEKRQMSANTQYIAEEFGNLRQTCARLRSELANSISECAKFKKNEECKSHEVDFWVNEFKLLAAENLSLRRSELARSCEPKTDPKLSSLAERATPPSVDFASTVTAHTPCPKQLPPDASLPQPPLGSPSPSRLQPRVLLSQSSNQPIDSSSNANGIDNIDTTASLSNTCPISTATNTVNSSDFGGSVDCDVTPRLTNIAPDISNHKKEQMLKYIDTLKNYLNGLPRKRMLAEAAMRPTHSIGTLPVGISIEDIVKTFPETFYIQKHAQTSRRDQIVLRNLPYELSTTPPGSPLSDTPGSRTSCSEYGPDKLTHHQSKAALRVPAARSVEFAKSSPAIKGSDTDICSADKKPALSNKSVLQSPVQSLVVQTPLQSSPRDFKRTSATQEAATAGTFQMHLPSASPKASVSAQFFWSDIDAIDTQSRKKRKYEVQPRNAPVGQDVVLDQNPEAPPSKCAKNELPPLHQKFVNELMTNIARLVAAFGGEIPANQFESDYNTYFKDSLRSFQSFFPGADAKEVLQFAERSGACQLVMRGTELYVTAEKSAKSVPMQQRLGQRPASVLDRVGAQVLDESHLNNLNKNYEMHQWPEQSHMRDAGRAEFRFQAEVVGTSSLLGNGNNRNRFEQRLGSLMNQDEVQQSATDPDMNELFENMRTLLTTVKEVRADRLKQLYDSCFATDAQNRTFCSFFGRHYKMKIALDQIEKAGACRLEHRGSTLIVLASQSIPEIEPSTYYDRKVVLGEAQIDPSKLYENIGILVDSMGEVSLDLLKDIYDAQFAGVCSKGDPFDAYFGEDSSVELIVQEAEKLQICRLSLQEVVGLCVVPYAQSRASFKHQKK